MKKEESGLTQGEPASQGILVLGSGRRAGKVQEMVRRLGLRCRTSSDPVDGLTGRNTWTQVIIIVPPLSDLSAEGFCRRARGRKEMETIPILVVGAPQRQSRALYRAGATGLFHWPRERSALVRTLVRLLRTPAGLRDGSPRDKALSARIEERLRADREVFGPLVRVQVHRGLVRLSGQIDAAWKASEMKRIVSSMSGVDEVITTGLLVPAGRVPDPVITRSVNRMLRSASGLEDRTFGLRVSKGHVFLTGTARTRKEMERVVGLIEQVSGVRGIDNLTVISQKAKLRDVALARLLRRLVRNQYPRAPIDVSAFGRIVVLEGKARSPVERRAIESLVSNQPGVERVVSKVG